MEFRVFVLLFFSCAGIGKAQLYVSNMLEYQLGNLPFVAPDNYTTTYDQVNISYLYQKIRLGLKFENFKTPDQSRDYNTVSQRFLEFSDKGLQLKIGNFYEIFGRGLYLRSYELPGVILEQQGFRKRYGFYRDIDGVLLKYSNNFLEFKALSGKPLDNTLPPGIDNNIRRSNLLEGTELVINFLDGWNIGGSYLRNNRGTDFVEYGSFNIGGILPGDVQFYSEYAQKMGTGNPFLDLTEKSVHGFYSSLNFTAAAIGISFEYKDYNDFTFGFNDPPPLIKEHQYLLLNRSTHVLLPQNETGWQGEAIWSLPGSHFVTLNITEAVNQFLSDRYVFKELFGELNYFWSDNTLFKFFADRSQEPLFLQKNRSAAGLVWENEWPDLWGSSIDIEYQTFQREVVPVQKVENTAVILTISKAPKFSGGIVWERSSDPGLTDNPTTIARERKVRNWFSYSLGYQYSNSHFVSIFYGKRRGGTACTAGICYEVLPFEGFELRITTNL